VSEGNDDKKDPKEQTLVEPLQPAATSSTAPRFNDPVIGASVDGYVVKSRLGTGGMGIVYEGEHKVIGKRAAIKVLRPEFSEDPKQLQRLVAEARAVNEVGHRGIIDVFGYGQLPDGRQCIVMEYLDGKPLEEVLKDHKKAGTKMPITEVLEVLDEVLSALNAAHSAKVVHRDLKPSNIFLVFQRDARFVKLLDFGIAKLGALGGSTPVSRASMIAGTPTYMAPEQARGAAAAPTMDLYSVGIMAFEMLTGQPPFDAESVVGMLMQHAETPPRRPSELRSEVPDALDELVLRLLAKKPEDRLKTADHVRAEVVRLKAHLKDPEAHRTLQDADAMPSVHSEILPMSVNDTMTSSRKALVPVREKNEDDEDSQVGKQTMLKPLEAPKVKETVVLQRKPDTNDPFSSSQQIAVQKSRVPVFLLAAGAGALFVAAAFIALRSPEPAGPVAHVEPAVPKPMPHPAPPSPPPAPAPEAKAEPAPTPPPVVAAPLEPAKPSPQPPPPPVVAAAPKPPPQPRPAVAAEPRVAPPPPPPSKGAVASAGLLGRLKKLEARLDKAQQGGTEVSLYLKQVQRLREKLEAGPLSPDDKTRVEIALDNLEKSSDY
jgi:serine/threonine protein kinase